MIKHAETICCQFADELFEPVWPFLALAFKGLIHVKFPDLYLWFFLLLCWKIY